MIERSVDSATRFRSIFCSFLWPRFPGFSGGDFRDFHLLRQLLGSSTVEFYALDCGSANGRHDPLAGQVIGRHTAATIQRDRPDLVDRRAFERSLVERICGLLSSRDLPVLGPRYHHDVNDKIRAVRGYLRGALEQRLQRDPPDFLLVSPQSNPAALMTNLNGLETRTILASYDVEAVRIERFAASRRGSARLALGLEARRAARFERENLSAYDGVIAVTELDKGELIDRYGLDPERVLVIESGVDHEYFAFTERQRRGAPRIVFVSSLSYPPNQQAARRLIDGIMPSVRRRYPEARLSIVGQQPGRRLRRASDGDRTLVTGTVDDVRPYLRQADVACVPLRAGSGIKTKILEAMSAGVPLVCTRLSLLGMDVFPEEHALVGETDAEIADCIIRLLDDPDLGARMARRARGHVVQRYAWENLLPRLDPWLVQLRERPRRRVEPANLPRPVRPRGPALAQRDQHGAEGGERQVQDEISAGLERAYRHAHAGEYPGRSRFGPVGTWVKGLVNRLTRHQLSRQTEFNQGVVYALHEAERRLRAQAATQEDLSDRLASTAAELHERYDSLRSLISGFEAELREVGELRATVKDHGRLLDEVRATEASSAGRLDRLQKAIATHAARLGNLEAGSAGLDQRLAEIGAATVTNKGHIGKLRADFGDHEKTIGELGATTTAQSGQLERVAAAAAANNESLGELRAEIGRRNQRLGELAAAAAAQKERLDDLRAATASRGQRLDELGMTLIAQGRYLDEVASRSGESEEALRTVEERLHGEMEKLSRLVSGVEQKIRPRLAIDQLEFARRFRGDEETIRERMSKYAAMFAPGNRVVDLGCGRGEFIEACQDGDVDAYGVDADLDMVGRCSLKGLEVVYGGALEHLGELEDGSLDGIFAAQVVEHLAGHEIVELVTLAARKLKSGALIVLETLNPGSFSAYRWYFADLSHRRLVSPDTLRFLLESAGFEVRDVVFSGLPPEHERLQAPLAIPDGPTAEIGEAIAIYNENLRKLNDLLFGMQDYAVIAER